MTASAEVADVQFFFDPICPWAWVTSRWTVEVARQRDITVDWRFIALTVVNADKDYSTFPAGYPDVHLAGTRLLRVAAAVRANDGNDAVGRWYEAVGTLIHNEARGAVVREAGQTAVDELAAGAAERAGIDAALLAALDDAAYDEVLRTETALALSRTGKDVGTPILTFDPGADTEASFFGPVISRIPRGKEAVEIWDAVVRLARTPGMCELKRAIRERPQFD